MLKINKEKLNKFIDFFFVLEEDDDDDRYHDVRMKSKSRNVFQKLKLLFER